MVAVLNCGYALKFVDHQTPEICKDSSKIL